MRTDIDLEFLQYCSNTELRELCDMLTHDEDGNIRFSEKLTEKDAYIENYPDNCKSFWKDIAMELQLFGGNTFANIFRHGHGPAYESIVYDVCKEMDVENIDEHDTTYKDASNDEHWNFFTVLHIVSLIRFLHHP